jgi:hypothetical protein
MVDNPNAAEIAYLPPAAPYHNEGKTVASWIAMLIVTIGAAVAGIGVVVAQAWLFWVGIGIVVVALIVGYVLRNMGYGQPKPGVPPRQPSNGH